MARRGEGGKGEARELELVESGKGRVTYKTDRGKAVRGMRLGGIRAKTDGTGRTRAQPD
jgi:hypothetical protein